MDSDLCKEVYKSVSVVLRHFQRDIEMAVDEGRLPPISNWIITRAETKLSDAIECGNFAEAVNQAALLIDMYRSDIMPRVNDGRADILPLPDDEETAVYPDDSVTIDGKEVVIWDTLLELPQLADMSGEARVGWIAGLGDVERDQLIKVCSIVVGTAVASPLAALGQLMKGKKMADLIEQSLNETTRKRQRAAKPKKRGRR